MKTPILGSSYVARSVNAADNKMVNLYPEAIPEGGKEAGYLNRAPGSRLVTSVGNGPIRGMWSFGGYLYIASGTQLYKLDENLNGSVLGNITGTGQVSMADNGYQLFIACNPDGFIYNVSTNVFAQITDEDFPGCVQVTYMYGLFIFNEPNSQKFWITGYDGTQIDPLEFAFAEISPDLIQSIIANHTELWIFGSNSIEVWYYSGDVDFPFAPIQGAYNEIGCASGFSVAKLDNTLFWLGQDARGNGIVYRAEGYNARRISTHAVEFAIQSYRYIEDAIAYTYQQDGHSFYVLTFPSADKTWVYDVATDAWHERASFRNGQFYRHRSNCMANFENQILVGDYQDGRIYALDLDYFADDEERQRWIRSWRALPTGSNNLNRTAHHTLQLDLETGGPITAPAEEYTYLRVTVSDNWGGTQTSINSIAVYDTIGGPNIATGGTPFASSGSASGVFSGGAPWFANTSSGEYVGYQFAAGVKPVQIAIEGVGIDGVKNFVVQVSTDNINYVQVGSGQIPFTANDAPKIGDPDFGLQDQVIPLSDRYGTESDGTYIYKTVISTPASWNGTNIPYVTTKYDLDGNVVDTESGTWAGQAASFTIGNSNYAGMISNTKDYWWAYGYFLGGTERCLVFYKNTYLFAVDQIYNPVYSFQSPSYWPSTSVKVGNAFYWVTKDYYRVFKYVTPVSPGIVAPSAYYVLSTTASIAYDAFKNHIWVVEFGTGNTIKFDANLNLLSTHPGAVASDASTNYPALCIYNGIGAIIASQSVGSLNNRYSIRDYTIADTVAPTVIRNEVATPPVFGYAPSSASLVNGYAYYGEVLIDLLGVATPQTFNLVQPSNPDYADPKVMLRWSDDGGHTWSNYHVRSMGKLGEYGKRVLWRRLGMTMKLRDRVYEISGNDPVKIAIMGAELDVSGTDS